jgi:hypothetical protein
VSTSLAATAALAGVAATAVIYGTDIFCALVLRPAAANASDESIADLLGQIHHYGDHRLPVPGVLAIIAVAISAAASTSITARAGAGTALFALLIWLVIYLKISAPINKRLREAASTHTTPAETRSLQSRWDTVIWPRAALQSVALAGLLLTITAGT